MTTTPNTHALPYEISPTASGAYAVHTPGDAADVHVVYNRLEDCEDWASEKMTDDLDAEGYAVLDVSTDDKTEYAYQLTVAGIAEDPVGGFGSYYDAVCAAWLFACAATEDHRDLGEQLDGLELDGWICRWEHPGYAEWSRPACLQTVKATPTVATDGVLYNHEDAPGIRCSVWIDDQVDTYEAMIPLQTFTVEAYKLAMRPILGALDPEMIRIDLSEMLRSHGVDPGPNDDLDGFLQQIRRDQGMELVRCDGRLVVLIPDGVLAAETAARLSKMIYVGWNG